MKTLLDVTHLTTQFQVDEGIIHAVDQVSFAIQEGEVLGIVGESGCGKSVTALSLMRLIAEPGRIVAGTAQFATDNKVVDLLTLSQSALAQIRGNEIAMIFQDPMTSLNPVLTIGYQVAEPLKLHRGLSDRAAREQAIQLLERVGIPDAANRLGDYPHQFSGGMRQRVMIAVALSCRPKLIIADEPTTALDVTIQAQIIDLLRELRDEFGTALIIITHDLGIIAEIADTVAVMYAGRIVEMGKVREIFARPQHPYTAALLAAIPRLTHWPERLSTIEGAPPNLLAEPPGCPFEPRCNRRIPACRTTSPPLEPIFPEHQVACIVAQAERAAHV